MHRYKIDNEDEYQESKDGVENAERLARRLLAWKNPEAVVTDRTKFRHSYQKDNQAAWEIACGITDELTGIDPDRQADAMADYVRDQPDTCPEPAEHPTHCLQ